MLLMVEKGTRERISLAIYPYTKTKKIESSYNKY